MKNDLISVIVPVYNVEDYIDRCIESITNQTYKNLEIILVDDGSSDKSLDLCKKWARKDNRIIVIHSENKGVSSARNIGLTKATGDYIGFIDSDDYIDSRMYELLLSSIKKYNSDIAFCGFKYIYTKETKNSLDFPKEVFDKCYFLKHYKFNNNMNYSASNKLYKKEIIKNIFFDTNIKVTEDGLFVMNCVDRANLISYVNKNMYCYDCTNQNSTLHSNNIEKFITSLDAKKEMISILKRNNIDAYIQEECDYIGNLYKYFIKSKDSKNINFEKYKKVAKSYINDGLIKNKIGLKNKFKVIIYKTLLKI